MQSKSEDIELLKIFLPELLVRNFDITDYKIEGATMSFYFSEKKEKPNKFSELKLHSKGFYEEAKVQDFPIRGKEVYHYIKRRRWIDIKTKEIVSREWDLVAKGTRMTSEFATFLKEYYR